jgi:thiosulfate/3-mercaptopyruvate sulfurtransferase
MARMSGAYDRTLQAMTGPLVSTGWLRESLGDPGIRVVDCRFRLGEPGVPERLWREGHIPGAAFLDVDRDLAAPPGAGGRHPLPDAADFEAAARRAGVGPDTLVVAYDEAAEGGAARLWWLLRHFGHDNVTVLDGGLSAWRAEGGPMRAGEEEIEPGTFSARPRDDDTVSAEELARAAATRSEAGAAAAPGEGRAAAAPSEAHSARPPTLLDARAPERYRGEVEPIDPVAGRIPGAANLPFAEVAPGGRFLPAAELRARFEAAGAESGREAVAYCGSGVTACVLVLAAEVAGLGPVRLYPGSWSEWSGRGLPMERGPSEARH